MSLGTHVHVQFIDLSKCWFYLVFLPVFFWPVTDRCTLQSKSRRMCIPPNSGDIFPKDKIDKGNASFMGLSPSMDMFLFTCFFMGGQGVTFDVG